MTSTAAPPANKAVLDAFWRLPNNKAAIRVDAANSIVHQATKVRNQ